jgi:hypothetical protein
MKVKATRGVCIGVGRHLAAGDVEDLEPALVTFLVGIGAVERVPDEPPKPVESPPKVETPDPKSVPDKTGKKEK